MLWRRLCVISSSPEIRQSILGAAPKETRRKVTTPSRQRCPRLGQVPQASSEILRGSDDAGAVGAIAGTR